MKAEGIGRKAIKAVNGIVDIIILTVIILLVAYAVYALWDSKQIYRAADKAQYAVYKPTAENEGKSFKELQAINAEVIAWLSVYGTNIDYPVTQGPDNMKYVNTNAEGLYSLSGSIFLDAGNSKDFSDYNSIIYGHHMENKVMFGDIGTFSLKSVFDSHRYGNLYFDEKDHGLEFFAFVHTDAYDGLVFTPNVREENREAYLAGLAARAIHERDIGIQPTDRIILLSTCSSSSTNGRDILIGRLTGDTFDDPFAGAETDDKTGQTGLEGLGNLVKEIPLLPLILLFMLAGRLIVCIVSIIHTNNQAKKENRKG